MKRIIAISLLSLAALLPQAKAVSPRDTITDNNIIFPPSFSMETKNLHENWYLQRYTLLDSAAATATGITATDEVYKERLQKLPNIIEMPYNSIVKAYIEMYATRKQQLVEQMLGMSLYYMPIFEEACEKCQVPMELKYLPVIESALNPNAVSKAGACGLWQFMAATAQGEGLEISTLVDERRDPIASSEAAVRYLQKLHDMYDDWTLAIAAYNCGPGNVNKAIQRAGDVKDYWAIYPFLPQETRGYVPAFIAANYIMNYYPEHGISHALARKPIVTDTVHVCQRVHFQQISDVLGIPMDELRILNPQYRQDIIPGHIRPYSLILPSVQAYCYVANEDTIIGHDRGKYFGREEVEPSDGKIRTSSGGNYIEELVVKKHKVKKGETLKTIANKYGVTAESIRAANNLTSSRVKTGRVLTINTYERKYVNNDTVAAAVGSLPTEVSSKSSTSKQTAATTTKSSKSSTSSNTKSSSASKQSTTKKQTASTTTHTVKSGENLSKIAKKYGTTVAAIKKANGLKSDNINVGQKLKIPKK